MLKLTFRGAIGAAALLAVACTDASTGPGDLSDKKPPTVKLAKGGTTLDTLVAFQVEVNDDLGIKSIKVNVSGGASLSYDTTFTTAATTALVPFSVPVSRSIPKGTPVIVTSFALDGALTRLAEINPRGAEVVQQRFYAGLSLDETAALLGVSAKTVQRDWIAARAWLRKEVARELDF